MKKFISAVAASASDAYLAGVPTVSAFIIFIEPIDF